jgi:hypothetical protein
VELFESTIARLRSFGKSLTIGELAQAIPPGHDLETLVYWLALARQAGIVLAENRESLVLTDANDDSTRFDVPYVEIHYNAVHELDAGRLE